MHHLCESLELVHHVRYCHQLEFIVVCNNVAERVGVTRGFLDLDVYVFRRNSGSLNRGVFERVVGRVCFHRRRIRFAKFIVDFDQTAATRTHSYRKGASLAVNAANGNIASHLLYHFFANAKSEARSLRIHFAVFIESAEVHEELAQVFRLNANPRVYHVDSKLDLMVILVFCSRFGSEMACYFDQLYQSQLDNYGAILLGEFKGVGEEIGNNLTNSAFVPE